MHINSQNNLYPSLKIPLNSIYSISETGFSDLDREDENKKPLTK